MRRKRFRPIINELDGVSQPLSDLARRDSIRVLYVEDDTNCREATAGELSDRGFVVRSFADAASLLDGLDIATGADIIVLDRGLPDVSGIDLLAQLRQSGMSLSVVFLLATLFSTWKCLAFDRGAVDFIGKTRGVEILVKRPAFARNGQIGGLSSANPMICSSLIPI
jgi:two-component system, OmpR family, response regulator ChvI